MTDTLMLAEEIRDRLGYKASAEELAEVAALLDAIAAVPEPAPLTIPATRFDPTPARQWRTDAD